MSKAELERKHLADLHALAAAAGVPRYRMLRREELVEELLVRGNGNGEDAEPEATAERSERPRGCPGGGWMKRWRRGNRCWSTVTLNPPRPPSRSPWKLLYSHRRTRAW